MTEEEKAQPINFVKLHHLKSGFFRVIHADGAWGGVNQSGIVHMTFFCEHPAIPTSVTYPVDKNGVTINEPTMEGDTGVHREMEVSVALTIPAAMQVRTVLDNFIKIALEQTKENQEKSHPENK